MRISISWWERIVAVHLAFLLAAPLGLAATNDLPQAPQPNPPAASAQNQQQNGQTQQQNPQPSASGSQVSGSQVSGSQVSGSQVSGSQVQQPANPPQQPLGTAAAPYVRPEGIPASRPAGAVIAPAKQKRVRIIAIRIALIVGAAVAIGTVVAASEGSSSRP